MAKTKHLTVRLTEREYQAFMALLLKRGDKFQRWAVRKIQDELAEAAKGKKT